MYVCMSDLQLNSLVSFSTLPKQVNCNLYGYNLPIKLLKVIGQCVKGLKNKNKKMGSNEK